MCVWVCVGGCVYVYICLGIVKFHRTFVEHYVNVEVVCSASVLGK